LLDTVVIMLGKILSYPALVKPAVSSKGQRQGQFTKERGCPHPRVPGCLSARTTRMRASALPCPRSRIGPKSTGTTWAAELLGQDSRPALNRLQELLQLICSGAAHAAEAAIVGGKAGIAVASPLALP